MGQTSLCEPTTNFFNLFLTDSSKDVKTTNRSSDVNSTETTKNSVDSKYIVQHFNDLCFNPSFCRVLSGNSHFFFKVHHFQFLTYCKISKRIQILLCLLVCFEYNCTRLNILHFTLIFDKIEAEKMYLISDHTFEQNIGILDSHQF